MVASNARTIAYGLFPVDVAEEGLSAELQRMSERMRKLYKTDCVFVSHADDRVHDNVTATHLYHIAQEAVTNAIKHASPRTIKIALWGGDPGKLQVSNDNNQKTEGQGAEPRASEGKGSGLRIMRHRADIIKAKLSIQHAEDGSKVTCIFPNRMNADAASTTQNEP